MTPTRSTPSRPRARRWVPRGVAILVVLAAPLVTHALFTSTAPPSGAAEAPGGVAPIPVRTRVLTTSAPADRAGATLEVAGTLRARREATLAFAVEGVVDRVPADDGDRVSAGTELAGLDPVPFEAALAQAEARERFLRAQTARSSRLRDANAISAEELEANQAELATLAGQVRLSRWRLERSTLRAPFDGVIRARHVELGQVVGPGGPAIELLQVDTLEVSVAVPVTALPALDEGHALDVRVDDLDLTLRGVVDHRPVSGDPRAGTVPLVVRVPNPDGVVLPGLVAEVTVATNPPVATAGAMHVPLDAVEALDDRTVVYVVDGDRVRAATITTGRVSGSTIEVRDGLAEGARVVVRPPDRLRDGDPVRVIEEGV